VPPRRVGVQFCSSTTANRLSSRFQKTKKKLKKNCLLFRQRHLVSLFIFCSCIFLSGTIFHSAQWLFLLFSRNITTEIKKETNDAGIFLFLLAAADPAPLVALPVDNNGNIKICLHFGGIQIVVVPCFVGIIFTQDGDPRCPAHPCSCHFCLYAWPTMNDFRVYLNC